MKIFIICLFISLAAASKSEALSYKSRLRVCQDRELLDIRGRGIKELAAHDRYLDCKKRLGIGEVEKKFDSRHAEFANEQNPPPKGNAIN